MLIPIQSRVSIGEYGLSFVQRGTLSLEESIRIKDIDITGSYQTTLRTNDGDTYSFVSVDMCPETWSWTSVQSSRIYQSGKLDALCLRSQSMWNDNGRLERNRISLSTGSRSRESTATIFFGHYPLASGYSNGLQKLMSKGLVFLNGHLHMGFKHFYTRHPSELLEISLEIGSSKRRSVGDRCCSLIFFV